MDNNWIQGVIILIIVEILFFLLYRIVVWIAEKFSKEKSLAEIIDVDPIKKTYKLLIKLKEYFSWNVSVNTEKGTAGGNIKINFPIKSALLLGIICLLIACFIGSFSQFIITGIFLLFAGYYFKKWYQSLQLLKSFQEFTDTAKSYVDAPRKLYLSSEHRFIAGVCGGISEYFTLNLTFVRIIFTLLVFIYGTGIALYFILFVLMSKKPA